MKITKTDIPDVLLIEPQVYEDERGYVMETYRTLTFAQSGIPYSFVQDNQSSSKQGTLRGLHYQIRQAQGKVVRAISGEIFDVAVDLRQFSPTFGKWVGVFLTAQNKLQLWVPPGFAHGFYALSDRTEVFYKATDYYAPEWERTLLWDDKEVGIDWPLIEGLNPIISEKDIHGKPLREADVFNQEL
jgi:dTDP-4-dehydrorhamnose 3,5-epimerase